MNKAFLTIFLFFQLLYIVYTDDVCINIRGNLIKTQKMGEEDDEDSFKLTVEHLVPMLKTANDNDYRPILIERHLPYLLDEDINDVYKKKIFEDRKDSYNPKLADLPPKLVRIKNLYKIIELDHPYISQESKPKSYHKFRFNLFITGNEMYDVCGMLANQYYQLGEDNDVELVEGPFNHKCCYKLYQLKEDANKIRENITFDDIMDEDIEEVSLTENGKVVLVVENVRTGYNHGIHFIFAKNKPYPNHFFI